MKFTAPLTGHAAASRGEKVWGVQFDLGTPPPNKENPHQKKNWLKRLFCKHTWEQLGDRIEIMFYQERMGWAYHYVCTKCGETKVEETD